MVDIAVTWAATAGVMVAVLGTSEVVFGVSVATGVSVGVSVAMGVSVVTTSTPASTGVGVGSSEQPAREASRVAERRWIRWARAARMVAELRGVAGIGKEPGLTIADMGHPAAELSFRLGGAIGLWSPPDP
jgi:hypothetical protein